MTSGIGREKPRKDDGGIIYRQSIKILRVSRWIKFDLTGKMAW
jgi:hypothetical protein